jgi:threonine aldolase
MMRRLGATFYPWTSDSLPKGGTPSDGSIMIRLVCSFATAAADVDRVLATVKT